MESNLNLNTLLYPIDTPDDFRTGGLMHESILDFRIHEFLFIGLYFFLFIFFVKKIINTEKMNKYEVYFIISYHYIFIILSFLYSLLNVNDTDSFFQSAYFFGEVFQDNFHSNHNMVNVYYFLIYYLNLHYFTSYIFMGFFSSVGFVLIYLVLCKITEDSNINRKILLVLILFPSWHFFTAFPSKDSIVLFAISWFYYFLIKKKNYHLIIPLAIIYAVRPHISLIMLFSIIFLITNFFFLKRFKKKLYVFLCFCGLILLMFLFIITFLPSYYDYLITFFEKGQTFRNLYSNYYDGWYSTGNNPLINSLRYMFFPIADFGSISRILISIENSLLLVIILTSIINFDLKSSIETFSRGKIFYLFSLMFFLSGSIILSNYTANIGISSRQKWMLIPSLFIMITPLVTKFRTFKV